jgi:hypothetical protein
LPEAWIRSIVVDWSAVFTLASLSAAAFSQHQPLATRRDVAFSQHVPTATVQ